MKTGQSRKGVTTSLAHPWASDVEADKLVEKLYTNMQNHMQTVGASKPRVTHVLRQVADAYNVAAAAHESQLRGEGTPYIVHPLRVAYAISERYTPQTLLVGETVGTRVEYYRDLIIVGLCHDVLEDADGYEDTLKTQISPNAYQGIEAISKRAGLSMKEYYADVTDNVYAMAVKPEDRIDNLRFIHMKLSKRSGQVDPVANSRYLTYAALDVMPIANRCSTHYRLDTAEMELETVIRKQTRRLITV